MSPVVKYELYDAQIEKAKKTNELRRAAVASQWEEYGRKKIMLKTMLGDEVYRRAEDFIGNRSSCSTSMIHSILDLLIGSSDPMPTTMSSQEQLLQQLTATKTRSRPSNNGSDDIISTFLEYMRTTGPVTNERSVPVLETANMPPNASCSTAPPNYMAGAYVAPTQTPPARTFYGQMPPQYNGSNSPYPGMMPQPAHPPMPPQNPGNYFMGGCFPNQQYYPPYQ